MSNVVWQLEGDLRQAFENFMGERVSGPWDVIIETLAGVVNNGQMDLETAAKLNLHLARTKGELLPDECGTCGCCTPGQIHGAHKDPRLDW